MRFVDPMRSYEMGQLQAGAARIDITPHLGCEMAGYAGRTEGSRSIADPLYAKAIVLTDDQQKIALVTTDLIGVKSDLVEQGLAEWVCLKARDPWGNGEHDPGHPSPSSHKKFCEEVIGALIDAT